MQEEIIDVCPIGNGFVVYLKYELKKVLIVTKCLTPFLSITERIEEERRKKTVSHPAHFFVREIVSPTERQSIKAQPSATPDDTFKDPPRRTIQNFPTRIFSRHDKCIIYNCQ